MGPGAELPNLDSSPNPLSTVKTFKSGFKGRVMRRTHRNIIASTVTALMGLALPAHAQQAVSPEACDAEGDVVQSATSATGFACLGGSLDGATVTAPKNGVGDNGIGGGGSILSDRALKRDVAAIDWSR